MFERVLEKEITINASAEKVFDALTNSEALVKFFPLTRVESEWILGGEVKYHGEVDGKPFTDFGQIQVFDRPNRYQYKYWSDNHGTERRIKNQVAINYLIDDLGDGVKLRVKQTNFPTEDWFNLMNDSVWDYLLGCIKQYVE